MEAQSCPSPAPAGLDADACWEAVLDRDVRADGVFFYGVRSTKIYCRPSCPSRRPGRDQVVFFATAGDAGRGGFRPCLRCRPDEAEPRADLVRRACRLIESRPDETIPLKALGEAVGLSPSHLARTFKATLGVTPREYADACRLGRLKAGLKRPGTVAGAMYEAGYGSSSRLYERTDPQLGMTPTAYRNGGRGQSIRYTIADSPLGRLLVAATDRGLCAVILGDDDRRSRNGSWRSTPPPAGSAMMRASADGSTSSCNTSRRAAAPRPRLAPGREGDGLPVPGLGRAPGDPLRDAPALTARSPRPSGSPGPRGPSRGPVPPIGSPWSSPVIGSSEATATSAAIGGGRSASECSSTSRAGGGGKSGGPRFRE